MPGTLKTLNWRTVIKQGRENTEKSFPARWYYKKKTLNDTLKLAEQQEAAGV